MVVDAGVAGGAVPGALAARPTDPVGDLLTEPALTGDDVEALLAVGRAVGTQAGAAGLVALGEAGVANTTVAAALACGLLDVPPKEVVGLGAGADTSMLEHKAAIVAGALARARLANPDLAADPLTALAELGGAELVVLTGVTLGAAAARALVVLDGFAASLAALAAVLLEPGVQACLVAGQLSRERGHEIVLLELGLEPLLDLRMRAGEGAGAALASGLLLAALRVRRETARVDH